MKHSSILMAAALCLSPLAAQAGPTEAQQQYACMGDALRLCPQHIPNRDAIIQCMHVQRGALSSGCRLVFDASYKDYAGRRSTSR